MPDSYIKLLDIKINHKMAAEKQSSDGLGAERTTIDYSEQQCCFDNTALNDPLMVPILDVKQKRRRHHDPIHLRRTR